MLLAVKVVRTFGRTFTSKPALRGLDEFFTNQQPGRTGRFWSASELRLKSYDDLRKLWFVLIKERNMLETYRFFCTQNGSIMEGLNRLSKVKRSMKHIREVLGERTRFHKSLTDPKWTYFAMKRSEEQRRKIVRYRKSHQKSPKVTKFRSKRNTPIRTMAGLKPRPSTAPSPSPSREPIFSTEQRDKIKKGLLAKIKANYQAVQHAPNQSPSPSSSSSSSPSSSSSSPSSSSSSSSVSPPAP
eukprot:TRINITY_DN166_c5_g1_i1.p1 TRINITY_DN166_c5_g1~~TRINITY_DN166_c5_g1_i1.p1  ORF type:complete len:242 (-),score=71.98 TRINITY_DN166_c5_g1_i1:162-887(-)